MKEEAETLERLSALEDGLRQSVMRRDWAELDGRLREVQAMGEQVSQTEQMRAIVYQKIRISGGAKPEENFQEILSRVPAEERGSLAELHRRVRAAVEKVKCLTGGLDTYIKSAVSTMDKVLDEVFPERRGRIYTQRGELKSGSRPLMVSRSV